MCGFYFTSSNWPTNQLTNLRSLECKLKCWQDFDSYNLSLCSGRLGFELKNTQERPLNEQKCENGTREVSI